MCISLNELLLLLMLLLLLLLLSLSFSMHLLTITGEMHSSCASTFACLCASVVAEDGDVFTFGWGLYGQVSVLLCCTVLYCTVLCYTLLSATLRGSAIK